MGVFEGEQFLREIIKEELIISFLVCVYVIFFVS